MIFNPLDGGASRITVNAPAGSSVTASGGGESVSGTIPSGSTSVVLTVHRIAQYTVTCTYNGNQQQGQVTFTSFWTGKSISFSYAKIVVHTHPGASVSASKGGFGLGPLTADSNGDCTLYVTNPAAINSTAWTVTANNGSVSASDNTKKTDSYTAAPEVSLLQNVPVIEVSANGSTYTYKGATIDNSVVKIAPSGTGWKAWFRASCTVKFKFLKTTVSLCAIGKGGTGDNFSHPDNITDYGGGGGEAGQVDTKTSQTITVNTSYTVTIGDSSSFGSIVSAAKGANASGRTGGGTSGTFRSGGTGAVTVAGYTTSYSGPGNGGGGTYAFGDSGFDGVVYAHGGQGGDTGYGTGERGSTSGVYANPGAGGPGGGNNANSGLAGKTGIVLMKNAA